MIRSSRIDNTWGPPVAAGVTTVALLVCGLLQPMSPTAARRVFLAVVFALASVLGLGALVIGGVVWAVEAPLPELSPVAIPPANASPRTVVRAFVAALDRHDRATARALCVGDDPPCQFLDYYIRVRITQFLNSYPANNDGALPRGVSGVYVGVILAGTARDGGPVGEGGFWGYVLAPIGPHRAWRIVDEGTG
ncbi:MAG TPA: hypothetical protein VFN61_07895 [Acidimicrobiales bacterium]|nr:hypothetical protein [Acidimicrobiales bacterium]